MGDRHGTLGERMGSVWVGCLVAAGSEHGCGFCVQRSGENEASDGFGGDLDDDFWGLFEEVDGDGWGVGVGWGGWGGWRGGWSVCGVGCADGGEGWRRVRVIVDSLFWCELSIRTCFVSCSGVEEGVEYVGVRGDVRGVGVWGVG